MNIIYNKDPRIKTEIKDLLEEPIVVKVLDFNDTTAKEFSEQICKAHSTGQNIIPVVIDSFGGDVYALLSMISTIENSKLPVCTICVGKAMSAGAILLACGHPGGRFIDPNATIMLHEVSGTAWGQKLTDMNNNVNEVARLNNLIFMKMAQYCGHKDGKYFIDLLDKNHNSDLYLNCLDAKKHKIIDNIGVPEFQINITVDINLCFDKVSRSKKTKSNSKNKIIGSVKK